MAKGKNRDRLQCPAWVRVPRCRLGALGAALTLSLVTALAPAPAASAAGDPVASASFDLNLSTGFRKQLRKAGVAMKPKAFSVKSGEVNPISGVGSLNLNGKLRFVHGDMKVVYKRLTAKLGPDGALVGTAVAKGGKLKAKETRIFGLSGGAVTRNGFGADISGVNVQLLRSGAKSLKRRLDTRSLRAGEAGSLSVSAQPQTVEIITGTATVTPASGVGTVVSKLAAHCVNPSTGISAIAPASQPGGPGTSFLFPVTGGTVSPTGIEGMVQQVGGFQLANGGSGLPGGCSSSNTVTIQQSDLAVDLEQRQVTTRIAISGSGVPFGFTGEVVVKFPYEAINATFTADPNNHTVTSNGTVLELNSTAAYYLNTAFPQPSGSHDPSMEFSSGDTYGTASLTLQVR